VIATRGARNGYRIGLDDLPEFAPRAFLAAEDRRFYQHGAVEFRSIARAAWINLRAGEADQGGSTLTQQIAKTIFLSPERTVKRKLQEAIIAWRLEQRLTKNEVLELYLNRIYFGDRAYGLNAASEQYFGHSAETLSLAEAALLAALPKAPSRLAPDRNMGEALARSHQVLAIMREEGWITAAEEALARAAAPVLSQPPAGDREFGYVLDLAAAEATAIAGENAPDLVVRMTIDPELQLTAQRIVAEAIAGQGARLNAGQGALIAMTPDGAIRAVVGGTDHDLSAFNRATQARRQPGSAFKPLVFAAALELGVTPYDVRMDRPVRYGAWRPANYGGGYSGAMTVEQALARSVNTVAASLAIEVGRARLGEISRRFGLTTLPPSPEISVALGSYEVSLRELTGAYQVFQNAGARRDSYLISAISTSSGEVLYRRAPSAGEPAYSDLNAAQMVGMMKQVIASGTGRRADIGRPAAGKTGTSQDWRDAWFIGFTPDWAAGVWVGNDDNAPMAQVTGGDLPAQIWADFMIAAHYGLPPRDFDFLARAAPALHSPEGENLARIQPDPAQADPDAPADFYGELAGDFESQAAR
jgi:penicillin-binding protein 1A